MYAARQARAGLLSCVALWAVSWCVVCALSVPSGVGDVVARILCLVKSVGGRLRVFTFG